MRREQKVDLALEIPLRPVSLTPHPPLSLGVSRVRLRDNVGTLTEEGTEESDEKRRRGRIKRANRGVGGERARCSYEFHGRASLLRLLKTVEMLVPAEKEIVGRGRGLKGAGEGDVRRGEGAGGGRKERRKKGKNERVGRRRIEPILAQGTRVKYRRTGKLLPDVKFHLGANFAARAHVEIRYGVISILKVTAVH